MPHCAECLKVWLRGDEERWRLSRHRRRARFYCPECAESESSVPSVKLEEEVADAAAVVKRLRPKFLRVRGPMRRETLAVRLDSRYWAQS
jgi:hypothetical protein